MVIVALIGSAATPSRAAVDLDALDAAVAAEINFARTQPAAYAESLRAYRLEFDGKLVKAPDHKSPIRTEEGVAAVNEAILYLERQHPESALDPSDVLTDSAQDHVLDQGPSGQIGHTGVDGSILPERVDRHGAWVGVIAENIGYGYATGREVVRQLIVDDGVPDRGHRVNIFNPRLRVMGVACGPHKRYGLMCVIDFASNVRPN